MENENEVITQENDTETTENEEVVIEEETTEAEESVEDLKKKIQTLEAQKKHWREKANKPAGGEKETPANTGLSTRDTIAIMNAKVHEDDIDEVVEYARFKKISVPEALKSSVIKASLAEKEEKRTSANAANTRNAGRGASQVSVDKLMSEASSGKLPEKDEDINRLLKAKMGFKK